MLNYAAMLELISIHIPKTAGTSFYHCLQCVYGPDISISYKRRDVQPLLHNGQIPAMAVQHLRAIHGHFKYREVRQLHHATQAKVICWLRDPVARVISNFRFFKAGLNNPQRNPPDYKRNKHRIDEDLITYARRPENRNRMSDFLAGIAPEELFFVGRQSHYTDDLQRLRQLLGWPAVQPVSLNRSAVAEPTIEVTELEAIRALNPLDVALWEKLF